MAESSDVISTDRRMHDEALCQLLQESVEDRAAFTLDAEGHVVRWNAGAAELFGHRADEITGKPLSTLVAPGKAQDELSGLLTRAEQDGSVEAEMWHIRRNGERFPARVRIKTIHDLDGTLAGYALVVRDLSGRQDVEVRLHLLESVVESASDAVVVTAAEPLEDPGPPIEYVNPAFTEQTGYQPEEVIGESPSILLGPESDPEAVTRIREALEQRKSTCQELLSYRKDGTPIWVEVSVAPVHGDDGRLEHWVIIQRETTERRRVQEAGLEVARAEAARKEAERATAVYSAILSIAAEAIISTDEDQRITLFNRGAEEIFGYTADEVLGEPLDILIPEKSRAAHRDQIREFGESGVSAREKHSRERIKGRRKNGEVFPMEASISQVEVDGKTIYTTVARDVSESVAAAREHRETMETLQALVQAAPVAIAALDLEGKVEIWNPAAERIFGWSADEVRGKTTPIVPEEQMAELRRELEAAEKGELIVGRETIRQRKDGTRVRVTLSTAPLRDARGEVRGMMSLLQDVSERKRVEEEQSRLAAILEATPDVVATADPEGRLLYLNQAGKRMLGLTSDDALGEHELADLLTESEVGRILREALPVAIRDGSWGGETLFCRRDGREVPMSQVILAHVDQDGSVRFISTIARDVSDRRRREEELRFLAEASKAFASTLAYDTTLQSLARIGASRLADLCIVDINENGTVQRVALAHRDPRQESSLQWLKRYPPVDRRAVGVDAAIRTGRSELVPRVEAAWLRAAARDEAHYRAFLELGPRSAIIVPLVARDRTFGAISLYSLRDDLRFGHEQLDLAEELSRRAALAVENARLYRDSQEATRIRDEVLRIVAHDLRNPLNTISLSAGLLRETIPGDREAERRQIGVIERSIERADRLIRDLLDVARMAGRHLNVDRKPEDSTRLANEAVDLHRGLARQKGLRLEAEIPESLPAIEADRDRILQVFSNLIGNAIKFTPAGGTITIGAEDADREVRFFISDTGPGISEDQIPHLFDPFWQVQRGSSDGAGLGLAIVRGIVEAHGGRIWVESELGVGSTFRFAIPTAE